MSDKSNIPLNPTHVLDGTIQNTAHENIGGSGTFASRKREWYSRGYLPHRDRIHLLQSITFRLADSMPQELLEQLEKELQEIPTNRKDLEKRKRIEQWLDAGMGCGALKHPEVADFLESTLLHFDGVRYRILAWVIMPNHVHTLIDPLVPIAKIIQGWKSFSARWMLENNQRLHLKIPNPNQVWMREYWDRFIRDDNHHKAVVDYIHNNPVKAGLCCEAKDWPWSSAAGNADVLVGMPPITANEDVGAPRVTTHRRL